jgi:hypothetical protein
MQKRAAPYGAALFAFRFPAKAMGSLVSRRYAAPMTARPFRTAMAGFAGVAAMLSLNGCISTASKIITAPVRVVSKGADWATTSQSESDRNRGREIRHREERLGKLERDYRRHSEQCADGDRDACDKARAEHEEMQDLMPSVPGERRRNDRD